MSQNFRTSYAETLGKLETQYCKLKVSFCRFSYVLLIQSLVSPNQFSYLIQKSPGLALFWFSVY